MVADPDRGSSIPDDVLGLARRRSDLAAQRDAIRAQIAEVDEAMRAAVASLRTRRQRDTGRIYLTRGGTFAIRWVGADGVRRHQSGFASAGEAERRLADLTAGRPRGRLCKKCGQRGHFAKTCGRAARRPAPAPVARSERRGAQITRDHVEFATRVARKRANRLVGMDPDEAVSIGLLALVEAARNYRPEGGASLRTFAHYRIEGAILDAHRARNGRTKFRKEVSLDVCRDVGSSGPAASMEASAQLRLLTPAIASMSTDDRDLLIAAALGETLDEVGERQGVSRSWACRRRQLAHARFEELVGTGSGTT